MRCLHLVIPFAVALGATAAPFAPAAAQIGINVSVTVAPPELPVYEQPPLPAPGYIFTPGYWAYGDDGYYWVPGTWVEPPQPGLLWTPGYWGFVGGQYRYNTGYWGPTVGYYGGINYGFGYTGLGFEGGYWRGGAFFYNRAVNNFGGVHVTNVFERNVTNVTVNRYAFNGPGGVMRQPTPAERAAMHETHVQATELQRQHVQLAAQNTALRASVNHGRPAILATPRPTDFNGAAHPAAARPGEVRPGEQHAPGRAPTAPGAAAPHPVDRAMAPHTGHVASPRPVTRNATAGEAPHTAGAMAPRPEGGMSPRPQGGMSPRHEGGMSPRPEGGMSPRPMGGMSPRPEGGMSPRSQGGMSPRPQGEMSPRPEGAMAPHAAMERPMAAPHPVAAPHPAAAPPPAAHPAPRGEDKPKH